MDPELLIRTFPRLYHMAHVDAWDGICRHGLLSTCALLDLFEINGAHRHQIEMCQRKRCVIIEHPVYGRAVIRDNMPMDDIGLRRALKGMTPSEWYRLLNGKVFFWLTEERLAKLLSAGAYRSSEHCVLTINTRSLVERHADKVWLCPMNSGCTKPFPHPRSIDIFRRIADYPFDHWRRRKGGARKAIVELAVDGAVSDITALVEAVAVQNQKGVLREVWSRADSTANV